MTSCQHLRILYPASPLEPRKPDAVYAAEHAAAVFAGFSVSLFSFESFLEGDFRPRPAISAGDMVLYRGWMVTPARYRELHNGVQQFGCTMLTSPAQYERCHHLPGWYSLLADFTPETLFFGETDDIASKLRALSWNGCFLKDYVKSLAIEGGSSVSDLSRIPEVISKMKTFRGEIEGGICARRIEDFEQDTEARAFVFLGRPYTTEGLAPGILEAAAKRIDSPFFSVDTIRRRDGVVRIVELGDGQVSDRKKWTAEQFLRIFRGNRI